MVEFKSYQEFNENSDDPISSFMGKWRWLSNFSLSDVKYGGIVYPTVEHAYQAAKTLNKKDRRRIAAAKTPALARKIGQTVDMRDKWDNKKLKVMENLLRQKFKPHTEDYFKLIHTYQRDLIEGNNWGDKFWGVVNGKGHNHLGVILMQIRNEAFWRKL